MFAAVFDTKLGVTSKAWRLIFSGELGAGASELDCLRAEELESWVYIFQIRSCLQFAGILFCIIRDSVLWHSEQQATHLPLSTTLHTSLGAGSTSLRAVSFSGKWRSRLINHRPGQVGGVLRRPLCGKKCAQAQAQEQAFPQLIVSCKSANEIE